MKKVHVFNIRMPREDVELMYRDIDEYVCEMSIGHAALLTNYCYEYHIIDADVDVSPMFNTHMTQFVRDNQILKIDVRYPIECILQLTDDEIEGYGNVRDVIDVKLRKQHTLSVEILLSSSII